MNTQLIPVFASEIAGTSTQLVDARLLHSFLEVGKDFSNWMKDRIKQYDFQENQDYIRVAKTGDGENSGFQPIEYHLSLDMAKELSMVERNEKGKQARRYFIACENHLRLGHTPPTGPLTLAQFNAAQHTLTAAQKHLNSTQVIISAADLLALKTKSAKAKKAVPIKRWSPEDSDAAQMLASQGHGQTVIAKHLGNRTADAVSNHLRHLAQKQGGAA